MSISFDDPGVPMTMVGAVMGSRSRSRCVEQHMRDHLTPEPFVGSEAIAAGEVTRARLRGPEFVALYRDVYIGASAEVDLRVRLRAVELRAGPGAVIGGPMASIAWGAECPWEDPEAVLTINRRVASDGIARRVDQLAASEIGERYGVRLTSPARTAFDLARRGGPITEVVAAVDALAYIEKLRAADLSAVIDAHTGYRGLVRAREVVALMDPLAESLMETRTRLALVFRGLPTPVSQHPVVLPDGRRYRLDLAWPELRVAVEYDGEDHRDAARHAADLDRDAALRDLGWIVVRVTGRQVYRGPDALAAQVARLLGLRAA